MFDISKIDQIQVEASHAYDGNTRAIRRFFERVGFVNNVVKIEIQSDQPEACAIALASTYIKCIDNAVFMMNQREDSYTTGAIYKVEVSPLNKVTRSCELTITNLRAAPENLQEAKQMVSRFSNLLAFISTLYTLHGFYGPSIDVTDGVEFLKGTLFYGLTSEDIDVNVDNIDEYWHNVAKTYNADFERLSNGDLSILNERDDNGFANISDSMVELAAAIIPEALSVHNLISAMQCQECDNAEAALEASMAEMEAEYTQYIEKNPRKTAMDYLKEILPDSSVSV